MACSLYPCGFLFVTNIVIASITVLLYYFNPTIPVLLNIDFATTFTVLRDTT